MRLSGTRRGVQGLQYHDAVGSLGPCQTRIAVRIIITARVLSSKSHFEPRTGIGSNCTACLTFAWLVCGASCPEYSKVSRGVLKSASISPLYYAHSRLCPNRRISGHRMSASGRKTGIGLYLDSHSVKWYLISDWGRHRSWIW